MRQSRSIHRIDIPSLSDIIRIWFLRRLSNLAINAVFAETVPNEIRGRAYSATISYMMTFNALATFASGLVAARFSIEIALVDCGVLILVLVIILLIPTKFLAFSKTSISVVNPFESVN